MGEPVGSTSHRATIYVLLLDTINGDSKSAGSGTVSK
jgi:hypothetical protein